MSLFTLLKYRRQLPPELRDFLAPSPHSPVYFERRYLLESLQAALPFAQGPRLLDVGCGIKPYERLFAPKITEHIGVDYLPTTTGSYGRATKADVWGDSLDLPFPEASFDTVLSTQVIEHVTDPFLALGEIHRVLKPDGVLILTAPMTWPIHEAPHDYFRYTEFGLRSLLTRHGFAIEATWKRGRSIATLCQLFIDLFSAMGPERPVLLRRSSALLNLTLTIFAEFLEHFIPNDRLALGCTFVARKCATPE